MTKAQKKTIQDAYDKLTPAQQRKVDVQTVACNEAAAAYAKARDDADRALTAQLRAYQKLERLYQGHLPADFFAAL